MKKIDLVPNVLVVDDIPENLVAMQRLLKKSNVNIIKAGGGFEALELTMKHDFALVLMDVKMPEIDGYETVEMLKSTEHSKHLPVIFVTANSTEEQNIMKGYAVGAVDYLTKPVNGEILREKVDVFVSLFIQKKVLEKLNEDLKLAQKKAEESNQMKSDFLANMSHELRTPMHAIIGFCDIGLMDVEDFSLEEHVENLTEIKKSGSRLLNLINDLLDLSKLESKMADFDFQKNDMKDIVNDVTRSLKSLLEDKEYILVMDDKSHLVECDKTKIRQVMTNFLSNAMKFSFPGRRIILEFSEMIVPDNAMNSRPLICFSVIDEGVGIPEQELKVVFDKFIQSSKTRNGSGGTGLGLAICKEIISGHSGAIWAENMPQGGAKFSFSIPVKQTL